MATVFGRRFDELCQQAETIDATKRLDNTGYRTDGYVIDQNALLNWQVKAQHLISSACGEDSAHYRLFVENEQGGMYITNHEVFSKLRAVLLAAKEDYEGGYLNKLRHLIQAEVFDSELDQAKELFDSGYVIPAAVIAGVVLETGLREMCADNKVPTGKLDRMNADLAKAGVYSMLVQKQVTALAHVRNCAAHGKADQFSKDDVLNMIRDVPKILANT
jgi:hypothetical protein